MTLLVLLCTSLVAPLALAASATNITLPQLASLLAQNQGGTLAFTEYKYLHALKLPLRVLGTVSFMPPDHLERIVTSPAPESFVAADGVVTITEGKGRPHAVQMAQYPQLKAFVDAFTATLNGKLELLQKNFAVALTGGPEHWTLSLAPKDKTLADKVKQIVIAGVASQVLTFEIRQANGDHSVMQLSPLPADSSPAQQ